MLKKSLVTVIGAASILGIGAGSSSASTIQHHSQPVIDSEELVVLPTSSEFNKGETQNESNLPSTRATFNITASLGKNSYIKSSNSFYIEGVAKLINIQT
ncbi:hypothetical protein BK742_17185 [Bacillus thuringiensis serovar pingluonsis]|uniref:Uncharacterized protein n=3 Tax=Bacillus cereus group TaxID=86661 RepID=A0A9W3VH40_BACTU|nr:hypothetical protein [Bacillus thuringiensis]AMR06127.1 hypothetical protein AXW78_30280 [Bacillus thuringiensis]AYF84854.1 hypothetical protein D7J84_27790 [Bacillus thuringiensis]OTY42317.1 hypothetical protein BK742_17185 [Bacillus thuringiensis serovar pingluonsis]PNK25292.1 hypothetical protein CBR55_32205 [Bacillus thuringiensis]